MAKPLTLMVTSLGALLLAATYLLGQEPEEAGEPSTTAPVIAAASDEGRQAISAFRKPNGFEVKLFAAEPLVANPVAFCIDNQGQFFVCESFRQNRGVTDNRGHDQAWLDDDLASQTVADRRDYHLKHLGDKAAEYAKYDDRIRLLVDSDGDGSADEARVFAAGFNQLVDGTGAGVLARRGDVYFTCIPKLYLLQDKNRDGVADTRKALHSGYGVRVAFRGHDLHGLCMGPDGRLYFSIGDRGYHIEHEGKLLHDPGSGAVFRCELDGSNLEVFATGLRNPQELAFDDFGNLFTGDNNSDSGDRARWVYVMEGGDAGWRMAYQYLSDRGPFNREKIWHPHHPEQPAYVAPPIANFADGPSGLMYYPGVGLPDTFRGRFLLCDFRGTANRSGIRSFRMQPKGASFEMVDAEQPFWNILATDIAMGPNGRLYVTDWVDGWNGEGKGRIYQFSTTDAESPLAKATQVLLNQGVDSQSTTKLLQLLAHPDQRVRFEAQFELARRNDHAALSSVCQDARQVLLARLHAIWGLGQIARRGDELSSVGSVFLKLSADDEPEIRAQVSRLLGELNCAGAAKILLGRLVDSADRVRYFAAIGLGKIRFGSAVDELVQMLEQNNGVDPALRHAGVMGLTGAASSEQLYALSTHPSVAVRRALVVALRRQKSPLVASFLEDSNPLVVVEAARAIHDLPIPDAMPHLADLLATMGDDQALIRRVLNANYRIGHPDNAARLAAFAADPGRSPSMRKEAVEVLAAWGSPSSRDRVLGMWRPIEAREQTAATLAVSRHLPSLLAGDESLRKRVIEVAAMLGVSGLGKRLKRVLANESESMSLRAQALSALSTLRDPQAQGLAEEALASESSVMRSAARSVLATLQPEQTVSLLVQAIREGGTDERQSASADLGAMQNGVSDAPLAELLQDILDNKIPLDTQLDIVEAARIRNTKRHKQLIRQIRKRLGEEPSSKYGMALAGGNAERGRRIFFERTNVSCVRCHKVGGKGGEVGPDLSKIGLEKKRDYLLEAIVAPNKEIAKNFDSVMVLDADGRLRSGVLQEETEEHIKIITADGQRMTILLDEIEDRRSGKSAMPEDLVKQLSDGDLRDLVEFLSAQKALP
jgi:quinoprotein glucose dehydrogenase